MFYKYTFEEKSVFQPGHVITVKEEGKSVNGVILAVGQYHRLESLEPVLEEMAKNQCRTQAVLQRVERELSVNNMVTRCESDVTGSEDMSSDEGRDRGDSFTASQSSQLRKEMTKVAQLFKSTSHNAIEIGPRIDSDDLLIPETPPNPIKSNHKANLSTDKRSSNIKKVEASDMQLQQLMLAELRVQSTIMNNVLTELKDLNKSLSSYLGMESEYPKENATFNGLDGPFTLDSLESVVPTIFARRFLKQRLPLDVLSNSILCPKGKTDRTAISSSESKALQEALQKYFGTHYVWKAVVLSVNQMMRQLDVQGERDDIGHARKRQS